MTYLELVKKLESGNGDHPTYLELLSADEWTTKRTAIVERDNHKCTKCGSTQSVYRNGMNVNFSGSQEHETSDIIHSNMSIADVKMLYQIEQISILQSVNKLCHGQSNNNILFSVSASIEEIKKREIVVNFIKFENGSIMPLIDGKRGSVLGDISIPKHSNTPTYLHVHHTFYIDGALPWDYSDADLMTLCNHCHLEVHKNEKVAVFKKNKNGELFKASYSVCTRCFGAGYFPEYKHVENGVCFKCNGQRYVIEKEVDR